MSTPKCYSCQYRGTVPGDAHSCCNYPGVDSSFFGFLINIEKNLAIATQINLKAEPHGVRMGWFMWPSNFDPVWLLNCDGYKPQEKSK